MSDNELVLTLQTDVIACINNSKLPLAVKRLILENVLLRIDSALKDADVERSESTSNDEVKE